MHACNCRGQRNYLFHQRVRNARFRGVESRDRQGINRGMCAPSIQF